VTIDEPRALRRVVVVLFDRFELLDVFGPLELFGALPDRFEILLLGEKAGPVRSAQGPIVLADHSYGDAPRPDVVLVPGGIGTRTLVQDRSFSAWLAAWALQAELVTSICTGSGVLAAAGLLDGYRATSNKRGIPLGAGPGAAGGLDRPSPLGGRSRPVDLGRCVRRHGHDPGAHRPAELRRARHRRRRSGGVRLAPRSDLGSLRSQKRPGGGLTDSDVISMTTSTSLRCIRNVRPARPGTCRAAHGGRTARPGRRGRPSGSRSLPGKRNAPKALMV